MSKRHPLRLAAFELAAQIVFEYEDWGDEHVEDMFQTYADCGDKPPCPSSDHLKECCLLVQDEKDRGLDFESAVKAAFVRQP